MFIIISGVSGSGKTTVGKLLARALGWPFYEGDDYHPLANIEKMTKGVALTDEDRREWLAALRDVISAAVSRGENGILACSALKRSYRDFLLVNNDVLFVHLTASPALIRDRLQKRTGHFMNPALIDSQFATLEEPQTAMTIDASLPSEEIVRQVRRALLI
jgi:gluconokinase